MIKIFFTKLLPLPVSFFVIFSTCICCKAGPEMQNGQNNQSGIKEQVFADEIPQWKARWELAKLLSYSKRYKESIQEYEKLLAEKPGLQEASMEMAKVLFWDNRVDEAEKILSKLPPEKLDKETGLIMADIYVTKKEYDKAEAIYRHNLENFPDDPSIRLKLAEVLSWNKKYDQSLEQYSILLEKHPDDIQLRRKYAEVLMWSGKRDEAIKQLQKTIK
jgi:thioredoxin-like negative regulator of GroEL